MTTLYSPLNNQKPSPEAAQIASPEDADYPSHGSHRRRVDSIGTTGIIILVVGMVIMAAAIAILAFLWTGAGLAVRQANPGNAWQHLILSGWATRTVTLCSAAIRSVMVVQAGLVASMIASLLLERGLVPMQNAPLMSIARALSVQPYHLLIPGSRGPKQLFNLLCLFIIGLTSIFSLASIFISTILLSDFADVTTIGRNNTSLLPFVGDSQDRTIDFWNDAPGPYARFAEYTNDSVSKLTRPEFDDTGIALRAMLPFKDANNRTTIRSYSGPATIFDSRVICLAPSNVTISNIIGVDDGLVNAVNGTLVFNGRFPPPLSFSTVTGNDLQFTCVLPSDKVTWSNRSASNISICVPSTTVAPLNADALLSPVNLPYIVLNATPPTTSGSYMGFLFNNDNGTLSASDVNMTTDGIWSTATLVGENDAKGAVISITYCVTNPAGSELNVTATSQMDGLEPTLSWGGSVNPVWLSSSGKVNTENISYNTETVRRQLGATTTLSNLTLEERGILSLGNLPTSIITGQQLNFSQTLWPSFSSSTLGGQFQDRFPTYQIGIGTSSNSATMPTVQVDYQIWDSENQGDWGHVSLFLDVLNTTQSPARALQAWLTTLNQMKYYDSLSRFSVGSEATYMFSITVSVPSRWAGFATVVVVVVLHMLLTLCTAAWYLLATEHTMLGNNSWQVVAQLVSDTTLPLLREVTNAKDDEVKKLIRRRGPAGGKKTYGVVRSETTGRSELVAMS